jgi:hypothetical protein
MDSARKVTTVLARATDSIRFMSVNSFSSVTSSGRSGIAGACVDARVGGGDDTFFRCALAYSRLLKKSFRGAIRRRKRPRHLRESTGLKTQVGEAFSLPRSLSAAC